MAKLGFTYTKTPFRYISRWKDGKWDDGVLTEDNILHINESSPALHYGQQCFEGLKAYRRKDNKVQLFRPDENAKRLNRSCKRLLMPEVPVEKFIDACKQVVVSNYDLVPEYGEGASFYLRPFVIGVGENIGVAPAKEYLFVVFGIPVGSYFAGGLTPVDFCTTDYDRAAPTGTGDVKVGGNYAASLLPHKEAVEKGYKDCIYLDAKTHSKIEEVGAANFFGITKDGEFVTPVSGSILSSITRRSIMYLAEHNLGMKVSERDVYVDKLDEFVEAGACGTAAIITAIDSIEHNGKVFNFAKNGEAGEVTKKIYDLLLGIQFGDIEGPEGWIQIIEK